MPGGFVRDSILPQGRRAHPEAVIGESLLLLCVVLYLDAATLAFATTALLLVYGRNYEAWQVAVFGGAASAAGSATQLLILRWILASGHPWMKRFAPSRDKVQATLAKYPSASFLALTLARATPLPDAPLKIVAAVIGYPVALYGLATFLGSVPYYWALALLGRAFRFPWWVLVAAGLIFVVGFGVDWWRKRRKAAS